MRQVWAAVRFNYMGFFKNPRVILTFCLGVVVSFLLSERAMEVAEYFDAPMQAAEPFIWTFGDAQSLLVASLLLLLMFSDVPKLGAATPFYLLRLTKKKWLAAQFFYVLSATALYIVFLAAATMLLCMKRTFAGNIWSETAALLGYSKIGEEMHIPSTVKVMESVTPYGCMAQVAWLFLLYALTLSFLILAGNIAAGRRAGMILGLCFSLYGFLLDPEVLKKILGMEDWEMYKLRSFVGWVSPLNHAVYGMHDFGYDNLPTVASSSAVFLLLLAALFLLCTRKMKTYNFTFLGGGGWT